MGQQVITYQFIERTLKLIFEISNGASRVGIRLQSIVEFLQPETCIVMKKKHATADFMYLSMNPTDLLARSRTMMLSAD